MKKILLIGTVIYLSLFLVGCGKYTGDDLEKDFKNKVNDIKSYELKGKLKIINNEDTYEYDVIASYAEETNYKVSLKNKMNNHEQIILKNDEGVYVLTPSLNKSFKFQSEWPFNGSQTYLLQTIVKDIENDDRKEFSEIDDGYIFKTKVNYSNNQDLSYQKVYIDKELNVTKVEVYTNEDVLQMEMNIEKIDYKSSYKDDHFDLKSNMSVTSTDEVDTVSSIDSIIYPMYLPENTSLSSEEIITIDEETERVLLSFTGEKSFTIIQEPVNYENEIITVPVLGDPEMISSTIAAVTDDTITWSENGIEYVIVSENLTNEELYKVASSLSVMPINK